MKDILIVFCVLLVLLIIITALGGSIRPSQEGFTYNYNKVLAESESPSFDAFTQLPRKSVVAEESMKDTFMNSPQSVVEEQPADGQIIGYDSADSFASI